MHPVPCLDYPLMEWTNTSSWASLDALLLDLNAWAEVNGLGFELEALDGPLPEDPQPEDIVCSRAGCTWRLATTYNAHTGRFHLQQEPEGHHNHNPVPVLGGGSPAGAEDMVAPAGPTPDAPGGFDQYFNALDGVEQGIDALALTLNGVEQGIDALALALDGVEQAGATRGRRPQRAGRRARACAGQPRPRGHAPGWRRGFSRRYSRGPSRGPYYGWLRAARDNAAAEAGTTYFPDCMGAADEEPQEHVRKYCPARRRTLADGATQGLSALSDAAQQPPLAHGLAPETSSSAGLDPEVELAQRLLALTEHMKAEMQAAVRLEAEKRRVQAGKWQVYLKFTDILRAKGRAEGRGGRRDGRGRERRSGARDRSAVGRISARHGELHSARR